MKILHSISDLLTLPSVNAMYGGKGQRCYVAYVGICNNLKRRTMEHLVLRNSSAATGTSAVQLNPDYVTELEWWEHPDFSQRHVRQAAEMVAFDVLDPALRSRGTPQHKARGLYAEKGFRAEMQALFSSEPAGRVRILTLEDAFERIAQLEGRVARLERRSLTDLHDSQASGQQCKSPASNEQS